MAGENRVKSILLITFSLVVVVIVGYIAFLSMNEKKEDMVNENSKIKNITSLQQSANTDFDKSYQTLLGEYNQIGADNARKNGDSFVGKPITKPMPVKVTEEITYPFENKNITTTQKVRTNQAADPLAKQKQDRREALLKLIEDNRKKSEEDEVMTAAVNYKVEAEEAQNDWVLSLYPDKTPKSPTDSTGDSIRNANVVHDKGIQLIAGLSTFPSVVDTAVNSDNTHMKMVAHIVAGKLKGAQLYSNELALAGDGIEVKFSQMQWNGAYYRIEAYGVETATNEFAVASEVNNRWFSRIILPAIANGIGQTGQLYKNSNSRVILGNNWAEYRSTDSPNGKAVAGTIVGGIGEQAAKVLEQDAAKLPVKQVKIDPKKIIGIQFITPVYSADKQQ